MKLKPGRIILALLLLFLLGYGIKSFIEWRRPPQVSVEVPERVPAGEMFLVLVTSSKEVEMTLTAGEIVLTSSGNHWSAYLPGTAGERELSLRVVDSVGNVIERTYQLSGIAAPLIDLQTSSQLLAGDPLAALLRVEPRGNELKEVRLLLDGEELPLVDFADGQVAFAAVPFDGPERLSLQVQVTDDLGRTTSLERDIPVRPIERAVEVLQLPAEALALQTGDNAVLQDEMLRAALATPEPLPLWNEPFIMPISGFASSGYGDPRQYFAGGEVSHHLGADLAAPAGTEVRATADGIVVLAEPLPIAGGAVVLDHGAGISSRYYHLSSMNVEPGQRVQRGDVIASVGSTGLSTGPHLHWEMRVGGEPSSPLSWVDSLLPGIGD